MITASVLAAQGELLIWAIVPLVALGAFLGDNLCYLLGRTIGDPVAGRLFKGEKGQTRLLWAEQALRRRGAILIGVGRFIPGGRTATTFAAGTLETSRCSATWAARRSTTTSGCRSLPRLLARWQSGSASKPGGGCGLNCTPARLGDLLQSSDQRKEVVLT